MESRKNGTIGLVKAINNAVNPPEIFFRHLQLVYMDQIQAQLFLTKTHLLDLAF